MVHDLLNQPGDNEFKIAASSFRQARNDAKMTLCMGVWDCRALLRRARNDPASNVNSGWELNRNR